MPWLEAHASARGIVPMLVMANDAAGNPVAFLPFGVRRHGPFRVAEFLGGRDSNANIGLYSPDFRFMRDDLVSLLRAAAAKARPRPDLFRLVNQPETWEGRDNPLDIFPHQPSASFLHSGGLCPDPAAFVAARQSKASAKKARANLRKLEAMGAVEHVVASSPAEVREILDAFIVQKLERFRQKNIASEFDTSETQNFLERAALCGLDLGRPGLELHALKVGGRILSTYGGGAHRGRFHIMINSFDPDPETARASPGEFLLQKLIERKCREGFATFDLGVGEARYKDAWCDTSQELFDSIMPVSRRGGLYSRYEAGRLSAKRWIKRSSWAWPLAMKVLGRK